MTSHRFQVQLPNLLVKMRFFRSPAYLLFFVRNAPNSNISIGKIYSCIFATLSKTSGSFRALVLLLTCSAQRSPGLNYRHTRPLVPVNISGYVKQYLMILTRLVEERNCYNLQVRGVHTYSTRDMIHYKCGIHIHMNVILTNNRHDGRCSTETRSNTSVYLLYCVTSD